MTFTRLLCGSALSALLLGMPLAHAGELGVNVYGLSYHWERDRAKANGWDNEFNPGLGVRYTFGNWGRASTLVDAGVYRDSGKNTAVYGAAGLMWPLDQAKRFHVGGAVALFHSDTYNQGDPFIAPIPLLAWRFDNVTLNITHFPKVSGFNEVNTTAIFLTFPLR